MRVCKYWIINNKGFFFLYCWLLSGRKPSEQLHSKTNVFSGILFVFILHLYPDSSVKCTICKVDGLSSVKFASSWCVWALCAGVARELVTRSELYVTCPGTIPKCALQESAQREELENPNPTSSLVLTWSVFHLFYLSYSFHSYFILLQCYNFPTGIKKGTCLHLSTMNSQWSIPEGSISSENIRLIHVWKESCYRDFFSQSGLKRQRSSLSGLSLSEIMTELRKGIWKAHVDSRSTFSTL